MRIQTELPNLAGAGVLAAARLIGFLSIFILAAPFQFLVYKTGKGDPFWLPLRFHRLLVWLLGFRVRVHGRAAQMPTLFVANHASYLDIPVLGSVIPASFVAKSEVADWPMIGTMARMQNTVFIERKAARANTHRNALRERLEMGHSLILFPEGTSSDGKRTLPFKSTLFSIVEEDLPTGPARIQPVSVTCSEIGGLPMGRDWRLYYAWIGDMTLVKHLWDVFKIGHFTVDVIFHEPVTIHEFGNRKALSAHCQRAVAGGVEQILTGRIEKALAV